jgi:pimeloyl-ACP methyl ester carboxylesterase
MASLLPVPDTDRGVTRAQLLRLRDNRLLGYVRYGATTARCVVLYFHGLPGSRLEAGLLDEIGRNAGVQIVAVDRPGYGLSTAQPDGGWADWTTDVAQLIDALSLQKVFILGISGGGPFALACAHALPDRIEGVALVCALGPIKDQPDVRKSLPGILRAAFWLAGHAPVFLDWFYARPLRVITRLAPVAFVRTMGFLLGGNDRRILREPAITHWLAENLQESQRQGGLGVMHDARLHRAGWPFSLQAIRLPVSLWHGDADTIVPQDHGRSMHAQLPRARLHIVAGEGHFSLPVRHADRILRELVEGR